MSKPSSAQQLKQFADLEGQYEILKQLGEGAYGVVAAAKDRTSGDKVAIKRIKDAVEDKEQGKLLLRELKLLRHFRGHENVICIKDILENPSGQNKFKDIYIITDLMDTDLHRIIRSSQPISDDHVRYFSYQILRGLKYLHSANVMHRDLKPNNLLVNANCDLKICDLGLARLSAEFDGKSSREERRKQRELEEGRKAGLIPHELDEDGNAINPHIPQFMAKAPWYLNQEKPGLKHLKAPKKEAESGDWYKRGVTTHRATKFRKGACENCGAMTHTKKDCLERPRKVNAKKSQKDIAADEYVQPELKLGFESKRDRYNGFDANDYSRVVERYEAADAMKQKLAKQKELEKAFRRANKKEADASEDESDDSSSDEDDDAKMDDKATTGFANVKRAVRAPGGGASGTVRNLRMREDTAKYLLNLDVNSAYYDPKTRSMRENPLPNADPKDNFFRGDNAVRNDGQVVEFESMNRHAWEQAETGGPSAIHMQGAPSQAEALYKQFKEKKEKLAGQNKQNIMEKYGDASSGKALPDGLALGQTEQYVEYDRAGRLIKGVEKAAAKSRYEEDVFLQNHTTVWGSFWEAGRWGYACCKSFVKNSYCTGKQGAAAALESENMMANNVANKRAAEEANEKRAKSHLDATTGKPGDLWGSEVKDDVQLDPEKLLEALKRQDDPKHGGKSGKNKRGYNVSHDSQVTAEDMEAYRMKKRAFEDPMNKASTAGTDGYDLV